MDRLDILESVENAATGYENLYYHNSSVYEFVYVDDEFIIEGKNCEDLKFKLSLKGITLHKRQVVKSESVCEESVGVDMDFTPASKMTPVTGLIGASERELALRRVMAMKHQ